MEKKVPRRSRIRYSKDGAIIDPQSPSFVTTSTPKKVHKPEKSPAKTIKVATVPEQTSPIKVTIKPFEFSSENEAIDVFKPKREKKIKKLKQKEIAEHSGLPKKLHKRSFTSPTLTNTPLMSITPLVADSPNDSHNENSNASTNLALTSKQDASFLSPNSSFSTLLSEKDGKPKDRDSKAIESSIENTVANLTFDIANYKANRKRRKEKHRSRYSPDLLRSTSKHKHKRKKKNQDIENPGPPHPRITIKVCFFCLFYYDAVQ